MKGAAATALSHTESGSKIALVLSLTMGFALMAGVTCAPPLERDDFRFVHIQR